MSKKSNKREMFHVEGSALNRKSKSCPRCGLGVFLANHQGRLACGKCGYTEFSKGESVQEKPKEPEPEKQP